MKMLLIGMLSLTSAMAFSAPNVTINVDSIKAEFSENLKKICDQGADAKSIEQALDRQAPIIDGLAKLDLGIYKSQLISLIIDSSSDTIGTAANAQYSCIIEKKQQLLDKNPKMLKELHDSEAHKQLNVLLQRIYLQSLTIVNIGTELVK